MSIAFSVLMAVLGLAFGSFANVVIWRFPRGESLSAPPSHCPSCGASVRWRDNVPVASWVILRGRCRDCSEPISVRYPIVELTSAALWLLASVLYGPSLQAVAAAAFYYLLLILSAIDLDTYRLPNKLVGLCAAIGLAGAIVAQVSGLAVAPLVGVLWTSPLLTSLVGALVSGGLALLIAAAYAGVRKRSGFGMGDVKLLGAIGVWLGLYGIMVLFVASTIGAVVGIAQASRSEEGLSKMLPFGPFLALGAVVTSAIGPAVWGWYMGLIAS